MASAQCFPSTSDISPISWLFKKVKKEKEKMKDPKELRAIPYSFKGGRILFRV